MEHGELIHLLETIRRHILAGLAVMVLASVAGYVLAPPVLEHLLRAGRGLTQLVFLSPAEGLLARLKLALLLGLLFYLPVGLLQVWWLLRGRLARPERRLLLAAVPVAYGLFVGGVAFAYWAVLPAAMRFFLTFSSQTLQPMISVGSFVSFLVTMALPFGGVFELPLALWVLARTGLLNPDAVARRRRYVVVAIFVLAGVLTPSPDVVSQLMLGLPVLLLFELSLLLARPAWRRRGAALASARWAAPSGEEPEAR